MIILDGKKLSEKILERLKERVGKRRLKLAVVFVGDNPVSQIYIREKKQACQKIGIDFELFKFPNDFEEERLKKEIKKIAENPDNSGLVIQLPLPQKFAADEILNLIPIEKDIDVLLEKSFEKFKNKELEIFPPVVCAIKKLCQEYEISLTDKKIVLVGKGRLVGLPLSIWLNNIGADFSVVDKETKNMAEIIKKADIIISGVGKSNLITGNMVKQGAVVIDAGTSSCQGSQGSRGIRGDVDFEAVVQKASYITPVPGGVGPMTVACLIDNLFKTFYNSSNLG